MFAPVPDATRALPRPLRLAAQGARGGRRAQPARAARRASEPRRGRGEPFVVPAVAVRTGDTPAGERARFQREPADILITTPESLFLLLTSQAREALRSVETVIIDEIHALVPTKRGAHLALSLERLEALDGRAAAAHRALGHAAPARRGRAVPRRRGAARTGDGRAASRRARRRRCATPPAEVHETLHDEFTAEQAPSPGGRSRSSTRASRRRSR